ATRMAQGRKNAMRVEINGSAGSVAFDFERMNELEVYDATAAAGRQGFTRILTTEPEHPYAAHWWPTGHGLGYEHTFTHQIADLVTAIGEGTDPSPSFEEALHVQRVLAAVETSAAEAAAGRAPTPRTPPRRAPDDHRPHLPRRPRRLGRAPARRSHRPVHPVPPGERLHGADRGLTRDLRRCRVHGHGRSHRPVQHHEHHRAPPVRRPARR